MGGGCARPNPGKSVTNSVQVYFREGAKPRTAWAFVTEDCLLSRWVDFSSQNFLFSKWEPAGPPLNFYRGDEQRTGKTLQPGASSVPAPPPPAPGISGAPPSSVIPPTPIRPLSPLALAGSIYPSRFQWNPCWSHQLWAPGQASPSQPLRGLLRDQDSCDEKKHPCPA